ncbi:phage tail protein [Pseudomonas sp. NPDC087697]|uniref:phage tail protein n=1 Tax=Pseudomonas sp. NPDC087697 TaxID=3364447 RepID=UPI0038035770
MPWYKAGTVSVVQNSSTVTGAGTAFAANGRVGDAARLPDGGWYEVTNIASDTTMSIDPPYQGVTKTSGSYALAPMQGYVKDSADALRALINQFGGVLAVLGNIPTQVGVRDALGLASTDGLSEGAANLYFSASRAVASALTGLVTTTNSAVVAADSILVAAGKLQAQISARAAKGENGDITSLSGLTTALTLAQGGTGRTDGLAWGKLKGALTDQTDLVSALATKITGSKQGLITASVVFVGSGPTIINNFNVASITKVTTGIYDINFATPMDNTAFSVVGMACDDSAVQAIVYENGSNGSTRTLNKVRIVTGVPSGSTRDFSMINVIIVGGKN